MVAAAWTMSLSGQALARAGSHVNTACIGALGDTVSVETQSLIEAETGMSIGDHFAAYILSGAASLAHSAKVAMAYIAYDTTGYLSREADTLLNVNDTDYKSAIKNMKEFEKTTLNNPT